jgi:hypothetical protein
MSEDNTAGGRFAKASPAEEPPKGVPDGLVPHPWKAGAWTSPELAEQARQQGDPKRRKLRVQRASAITARATRWLWHEIRDAESASWLPLGGLVLLAGREGVGKSTIAYEVAAKITRGKLRGAFYGTPKSVVISATEDAWEQTVVPRLMAADADLDRVMRVDAETPKGLPEAIRLPDDLDALDELIQEEDVALVLLDPLMGTISGALDSHKDHDIRLALEPVARLASTSQVTVLGLIHENKSGAADLVNRVMASRAFAAVARAVLYAARDDELDLGQDRVKLKTPEHYLFGQLKNNLSRRVPFTMRYHIDGVGVGHDEELDETIWSSRITWDGTIAEGLQDIVRRQEHDAKVSDKDTAQARAARWLEDYLDGKPEGVPAARLRLDGERAGHKIRTLQRAAAVAGVHIDGGRHSTWSIPVVVDVDVVDGAIGADGAEGIDDIHAIRASATGTGNLAPNGDADES